MDIARCVQESKVSHGDHTHSQQQAKGRNCMVAKGMSLKHVIKLGGMLFLLVQWCLLIDQFIDLMYLAVKLPPTTKDH